MQKNRKNEIKKALRMYRSNKQLTIIYDDLINRFENIKYDLNGKLDHHHQTELVKLKEFRIHLYKNVDSLERGLSCLEDINEHDLKLIVEKTFFAGWYRTRVAQEVNLSEERITQLLEVAYKKLDDFII